MPPFLTSVCKIFYAFKIRFWPRMGTKMPIFCQKLILLLATTLRSPINAKLYFTVWIFHNFSITEILREINFGGSRSAKSAISKHLEALNFDFCEFLHFLKAENYQINKIQSPWNSKKGSFRTSRFSKIDFT